MIAFLQPLPIGNAVKVLLHLPAGCKRVRVLRKLTDTIATWNDANSAVVFDGLDADLVDCQTLKNGTAYFYRPFYLVGDAWEAADSASVTPAATARAIGPDPLTLVRDRLEAGLKAEVVAQRLHHKQGYIPCFTGPPTFEGTEFPIVTVKVSSDNSNTRALGDLIAVDVLDEATGLWTESEGALFRVSLEIGSFVVGNADIRNNLRLAIKKVIIGNYELFAAKGLSEVNFSQADVEDLGETYGAPMYMTMGSFDCIAPFAVEHDVSSIEDVTVTVEVAA